ncbi:MAG: PEPxxWA-CTERM sorting domain-containing protein [Sphingomonas sp.]|uniref:trypsin-like serine protease n=1 Tax=Sphingomonas sp. TaxID=28214 RepID=UPI001AD339E9|nr:trypsin-like serine protease [Sphingomonas sp.]MBN8807527.1 PEPxxWA-CTERM sorting domain-containing protein [Sphingomonas sp.]
MKNAMLLALAGATFLSTTAPAFAGEIYYNAQSQIIGQTSTNSSTLGGDSRYFATDSKYSSVVSLIMKYADGTGAICSGSLLSDRQSVLTAAHCVSHGQGTAAPVKTTAYFYNGTDPDKIPSFGGDGVTAIDVSKYFVNSGYTGEIIDQNDIAVLRLGDLAPSYATGYDLYTGPMSGQTFNVTGYGGRSSVGGAVGTNVGTGVRRQGYNTYDYQIGDSAFNGGLESLLRGTTKTAQTSSIWLADFDNGTTLNDGGCKLAGYYGVTGSPYCGTGLGASEVITAPGDSGGSSFIDGKISSVTSFGITFGINYGDFDNKQDQSWGEFSGLVPVNIHSQFILSSMVASVPEPQSWAMMIVGFGLMGGSIRRSRRLRTAAAA